MPTKKKTEVVNRVESHFQNGNGHETTNLTISPPNLKTNAFRIIGTAPYVQNKFSNKAKEQMKSKQEAGSTAKKSTKRSPKDFQECYDQAQYKPEGQKWENGAIPATAFKAAMVAACHLVDFKMTEAKQCIYIEKDGQDADERIPLIRITKGKPKYFEQALRCANGQPDIRARPMWDEGWECIVRITYDADRFTMQDVANLLMRAGTQVGIGWGAFRIATPGE